jgi:D-xylono/L-arabinono-1,4-lactonase
MKKTIGIEDRLRDNFQTSVDIRTGDIKMEPGMIVDCTCELGENPLWHPDEKKVLWTDITRGELHSYDLVMGDHNIFYRGDPVGGFTIQEDGSLLLFMDKGSVKNWKDGRLTTVIGEIAEERDSRFNDVIADPMGRVFCGTVETKDHPGALYRLELDRRIAKVVEGVGVSNGIGFSPDRKTMYYTDSPKQTIYRFDYDEKTGEISNRQDFIRIPENLGSPDGMTVDAEGHIWTAIWDGSCLIRFSPHGREELRVGFPAKKVSSVIFGGPDYEDMFITTAGGDKRSEEGRGAGALFQLRPEIVRGVPKFRSRIKT